MNSVQQLWSRSVRALDDGSRAVHAVGILRASIGLISFIFFVSTYVDRHNLFGPDGFIGVDRLQREAAETGRWTLFSHDLGPVYFESIFHAGLVTSICVLIGVGGRVGLLLHYVFIWSAMMAAPMLMDGGDNLLLVLIPFLLLTRCYSAFAIPRPGWLARKGTTSAGNFAHTLGVSLIAVQICIVYLMAGLYKVQGQLWQDGTALYYILRVPEFYLPNISPLLFQQGWLLVIGAYATVLISIAFPFLVIFKAGRVPAVLLMVTFHFSIAVFMGLTSFALIMISTDLIFVNEHARNTIQRLKFMVRHASTRLPWFQREKRAAF